MSNFNQNNINFTISQYTPTKLTKRASTATYDALLNNRGTYIVNAVEIDWNGAELDDNTTITSTGELLSIIKDLKERLDAAELLIRGIYASMSTPSQGE